MSAGKSDLEWSATNQLLLAIEQHDFDGDISAGDDIRRGFLRRHIVCGCENTNYHQAKHPHKFLHFDFVQFCDVRDSRQNPEHTCPRTRPRRVQGVRGNFNGAIIRSLIKRFNSAKEVVAEIT